MGCHREAKKNSMTGRRCSVAPFLLGASSPFGPLFAVDVSGVWSSDAAQCGKMFKKTGGQVTFIDKTGLYGTALIVEGNKMTGTISKCTIKNRKEDGGIINIIASCANDVMFLDIQFSGKLVDNDTLVRLFPSMLRLPVRAGNAK